MKNLALPWILAVGLAAALVIPAVPVHAQEKAAALSDRAPAGAILHDTVAIAEIDLDQIDVANIFAAFVALTPEPPPAAVLQTAQAFVQQLRDAGVGRVYLTVPARWIPRGGVCIMIPCREPDAVSQLLAEIVATVPPPLTFTLIQRDNLVIICPQAAREFFEGGASEREAAERPGFDAGFASVSSLPHRLVIDLPGDIQQEIASIWPADLAIAEGLSISPKLMMQSVQTIAIGCSLPPQPRVEMQLACRDEAAAEEMRQLLGRLLERIPAPIPPPTIEVEGARVVVKAPTEMLQRLLTLPVQRMKGRAADMQTMNNLKQLALAMHNYHDVHGHLPGKYTVDAEGRPLLSWRVALLPFVEEMALYKRFKLNEPWDSPHNRPLIAEMPKVFAVAGDTLPKGHTRIRVPVVAGSAWEGTGPPRTFKDFTDGLSNTIWVAVAPESAAVEWTKPDDWELDAENLISSFFGDAEKTPIGISDGSVRMISRTISPEVLLHLLTMAGGEVIPQDAIK